MAHVTRRSFLLSSAALSAGCAMRGRGLERPGPSVAVVRQPAVGQSWHYAKHDLYTHAVLDDQIDRIAKVDHTVDIDSVSDADKGANATTPPWGSAWLRRYIPHRESTTGALPSEIQDPWGKILVDPHWSQVQVYEEPIPLWPDRLEPGWRTHISTKYKTPTNEDGLPWDQTMIVHGWETITVPAGSFRTLRFTNLIDFRSVDFAREISHRQETIWFAPEVGRWVARESSGSYYIEDSSVDSPYSESGYRWELLSYT